MEAVKFLKEEDRMCDKLGFKGGSNGQRTEIYRKD